MIQPLTSEAKGLAPDWPAQGFHFKKEHSSDVASQFDNHER